MKAINLNEMSMKTAIRVMMEGTEYKQFQEVAEALGIKKSTFQAALDNNSLRTRDLLKVAELLGYELKLEKRRD